MKKDNVPASLQRPGPRSNPSIKCPSNNKNQKPGKPADHVPTFDIPFGSNKTSAKRTSPAVTQSKLRACENGVVKVGTLTHKVLEVVPLDIVREVADVDTTVLL